MKTITSLLVLAVLGLAGCGHLDLTPEGNPDRVLTGTVEWPGETALPADTVVVVRVLDPAHTTIPSPTAVLGGVVTPPPEMSQPPSVLGEQTIRHPARQPVSFRIEYTATDEQLRRGLNIEARVAVGGRVRFANRNSYAISLGNVSDAHGISLDTVGK